MRCIGYSAQMWAWTASCFVGFMYRSLQRHDDGVDLQASLVCNISDAIAAACIKPHAESEKCIAVYAVQRSHRCQNVTNASVLHVVQVFESLLTDHDPAVNFSNWNYFAGIGNDPRNRVFKTVTQGEKYDESGALIATWLPALAALPPRLRHRPWLLRGDSGQIGPGVCTAGGNNAAQGNDHDEGAACDELLGVSEQARVAVQQYALPIVDPETQCGFGGRWCNAR